MNGEIRQNVAWLKYRFSTIIADLKANSTTKAEVMIREQCNGRARLAVEGRSRSSRAHRQQLCSASPDQTRPASRIDRRSASSARQSRAWHAARAEPAAADGAGPAIGTARVCPLPRMRISRANAAPALSIGLEL